MDIVQMRCVLAVAKYLNFTKAAECLNTSQSTVSKRIAFLEDELGIKLFTRTKQHVSLTAAGRILYRDLLDIVKRIDSAMEDVKNAGKGVIGELHIGFHSLLDLNRILPGFFNGFSRTYPDIKLIIESYNFKELRNYLLDGTLDVILTFFFEQRSNPDIMRLMLNRANTRVYYSRLLPEAGNGQPPKFHDFSGYTLIVLQDEESPDTSDFLFKIYDRHGLARPKRIFVNTLETMLFYLESGAGVALLGSSYRLDLSDKIASIELDEAESRVGTDALWLQNNPNPSLPVFTDVLATLLRQRGREEAVVRKL